MTRIIILILAAATIIAACSKDKFQTKPTLTLKSQNGNVVPPGASLLLEFEFTDKEGDVNDTIFVQKIRTNSIKVPTIRDSFGLKVPEFPKNTQGTIQLLLDHGFYLVSAIQPPKDPNNEPMDDTLMLKFTLRDRALNVSDTVTVGPIIVVR